MWQMFLLLSILLLNFVMELTGSQSFDQVDGEGVVKECGVGIVCKTISDSFTIGELSEGYNYVTTIPSGARNLIVKEIIKSDNLLVLKTIDDVYIVNGYNQLSEDGIYEYNNDVFDYNRFEGVISSKGPLNQEIIVMLLVKGFNRGIYYEYRIPITEASQSNGVESSNSKAFTTYDNEIERNPIKERRKRWRYAWQLMGFEQCNRSCGPGIQMPIFRCIRETDSVHYYSSKRCAHIELPQFSPAVYQCNYGLCPAYWLTDSFKECECTAGSAIGLRKRNVYCVQEQANGRNEKVDKSKCLTELLPELEEACNCEHLLQRTSAPYSYRNASLISASKEIHPSLSKQLNSSPNNTKSLRYLYRNEEADKTGVWLRSEWMKQCSQNCLNNFEYRSVYCDRTAPYTDLCSLQSTPIQKRRCSIHSNNCKGLWFTSDWSNCTGDCFKLQQNRKVLCLHDGMVVNEDQCQQYTKPETYRNCSLNDVDFCGPKWHYSEWSKCSRTCGGGVQRRYAKCLEFSSKHNLLIHSNKCRYSKREPVYGVCNLESCSEVQLLARDEGQTQALPLAKSNRTEGVPNRLVVATVPQRLQNCLDELTNCKRIVRSRLCKLEYYQIHCCLTCYGFH